MNSSMIGKIEKAHRYAREPERIQFQTLEATFRGSHDDYTVRLANGEWQCSCNTFMSHAVGTCRQVMAMQQILSPMLTENARYGADAAVTAAS